MRKQVAIVGAGPAALMLASRLDPSKFEVTVYEQQAAPARKFLVAGDGGLNITHSEDPAAFIRRYTPSAFLEHAFQRFSNRDLIGWLHGLGVDTYTGSSGRVFPAKAHKPIDVLNLILARLKEKNVTLLTKHKWTGFAADGDLLFDCGDGVKKVHAGIKVFALGGASWPVTGSTGKWDALFRAQGVSVLPFEASNCAFGIDWPAGLAENIAGKPLKNVCISCGTVSHIGEAVLTKFGIEGSGIYPLSPQIRQQLHARGYAEITIDLKPTVTTAQLLGKITTSKSSKSYSEQVARQLHLNRTQLALIKSLLSREEFLDPSRLVESIKQVRVRISRTAPTDEAISTVGGIALHEIDSYFRLRKIPNAYAIGEMLDYDAPTGGYLLQSCLTMGSFVADRLNEEA